MALSGNPAFRFGGAGTNTITSSSITGTTDQVLFVFAGARNGSAFPNLSAALSDSSTSLAFHLVQSYDGPSSNAYVRGSLWWARCLGTNITINAQSSGNSTFLQVAAASMDNDPDCSNIGWGRDAAGDPTATIPNALGSSDWALTMVAAQNGSSFTVPTGYTLQNNTAYLSNQFRLGQAYDITSPSLSCNWVSGNVNSIAFGLQIKEQNGEKVAPQSTITELSGGGGGTNFTGTLDLGSANNNKVVVAVVALYCGDHTVITGGTLDGVAHDVCYAQFASSVRTSAILTFDMSGRSGTVNWQLDGSGDLWNRVVHWHVLNDCDIDAVDMDYQDSGVDGSALSRTLTSVDGGLAVAASIGFDSTTPGVFYDQGWNSQAFADGVMALTMRSGHRRNAGSQHKIDMTMNNRSGAIFATFAPKITSGGGGALLAPKTNHYRRQRQLWVPRDERAAIKRNPPVLVDRWGNPLKRAA